MGKRWRMFLQGMFPSLYKVKGPRDMRYVTWEEADKMIKADPRWKLAPEEDHNHRIGMVFIELK